MRHCTTPSPPPPCRPQSGITVSDALLEAYEQVKLKAANKYLLFTLEKVGESGSKSTWDWKIVEAADKGGDNKAKWEEMTGKLPEDEARFVVFDFEDTKADGRLVKKLVLIKWCVPLLTRRAPQPCPHGALRRSCRCWWSSVTIMGMALLHACWRARVCAHTTATRP